MAKTNDDTSSAEGVTLDAWVREHGPMSVRDACECIRQAAAELQNAFECGMIYRDINPQKLLRTPLGRIKIAGYGVAVDSTNAGRASETAIGVVLADPDYMAPEAAKQAERADIRSDIYSLGCTLYFLLAGRPPFPGGTAFQKIQAHFDFQARPVGSFRSDVPPELEKLLHRMMAKSPERRYQTPIEVGRELAAFSRNK